MGENVRRVVVAGATGFIGRALIDALRARGDTVVALTRRPQTSGLGPGVEVLAWNPPALGAWQTAVNGAYGVVNLAGAPIAEKRWTPQQKALILDSRLDATRALVAAIEAAKVPPEVLVNASAIGYYGDAGDAVLTENSAPGTDFLARVVQQWEAAAAPVEKLGVRVVWVRSGIVLGREGGALPQLARPFRLFGGGTLGPARGWVSWIHIDDEVGLILYALDHNTVHGALNATAPNPVTWDVFSRQIGEALARPDWNPFAGLATRLVLGERSASLLASQRVLPAAATGYQFRHVDSGEALRSLLS